MNLDKVFEWVKKHKIKTTFIILGFFVAPLLVIHLLFKWSIGCDWFVAEWSAGDMLGYIGSFLAFLGTVALGTLALWQNKKANAISKNLLNLEYEREKEFRQPFILVESHDFKFMHTTNTIKDIDAQKIKLFKKSHKEYTSENFKIIPLILNVKNTSQNHVSVSFKKVRFNDNDYQFDITESKNNLSLRSSETGQLCICFDFEEFTKMKFLNLFIEVELINMYGEAYIENFDVICIAMEYKNINHQESISGNFLYTNYNIKPNIINQ